MAMDGIRKIARASYDRASEEEKNKAYSFFRRIDVDGDGKISFQELKAYMPTTDEKLFREFDASGDGTLDFDEALALYYTSKKTTFRMCDVCQDLLMGSFFSCLPCHDMFPNTFDLCIDCYCGGNFKHEHDLTNFFDHHDLLYVYGERTSSSDAHKGQGKFQDSIKIAKNIFRAGTHIAHAVSQLDLDYGEIASDIEDAVSDSDCTIM
ncbi:hypothetical protein CASFOL_030043 [Castilleja foliolosa]|uniref:EF-hand domain-containing protein n=1 Tax=Castilleja foliolosa TaxID=1961234 RepID=A0ABD3CAU9_9LAMI